MQMEKREENSTETQYKQNKNEYFREPYGKWYRLD